MSLTERNLREMSDTLKIALTELILAEQKIRQAQVIRNRIAVMLLSDKDNQPPSGCDDPDHEERE